ncbi:peptide-methionine (S)-S-oxide reductase MsrA [Thermoleophilia bacterium SCSIO 60948]|nr:peptide-methionine (S)-S-oxide reductase MsrA [Thermoleophilia bacterium SCSIO 60948]
MSEIDSGHDGVAAPATTETATFAAGCFWKPEAAYREVEGVVGTAVGYAGGHAENPTYEQVCSGRTGHAEVVEVTYDPERVSYAELLDRFWAMHDPTQRNRQGFDVGSQYRSAIFTHSEEQRAIAEGSRDREQGGKRRDIVTEIEDAGPFWRAEEYHQCYLERRRTPAQMLRALIGR